MAKKKLFSFFFNAPKGNKIIIKLFTFIKNNNNITHTASISFPFNGFTYCLTLFSEFFSSFPHGTCSLSVSGQYLALDEIYHPIRVGIPTNSTLRTQTVCGELRVMNGILTLHDALFQGTCTQVTRWHYVSNVQLAKPLGLEIFTLSSSRFTRRY